MGNGNKRTFASDAAHSLRNGTLSVRADRGPDTPRITVLDRKAGDSYPVAWTIAIFSDGGREETSE